MVNIKIIIPIIIVIIIAGVILFNSEQEIIETEIKEEPWHASGPFSIDKIEYNLGEKIFIIVNDLKTEYKGEV
jgi:hypothetical protein